jgi:hypothetical protein
MQIGHGAAGLATVPGEPLGGYADRRQGAHGTLDPLEVHAIVLDDGRRRTALVVVDLVCVNVDLVNSVRAQLRAELQVDVAWLLATHTHSGPESGCHPGGGTTEPGLALRVRTAARSAVGEALASLRPATLVATRALVPGLATRRTAEEPAPLDIPVDLVTVLEGSEVVGLLAVCPVHPTVLPSDNVRVSADLAGGIRRALHHDWPQRADGTTPWAVVATGAAGDISTRFSRRERTPDELDRLGHLVTAALVDTAAAPPLPRATDRAVRHVHAQISLQGKDHERLPHQATAPDATTSRNEHVFRQGLAIARELTHGPTSYTVTLEALDLGDVTIVAVPGELFLELGEAIRSSSATPLIVVGYANGYLGYLPTRNAPLGYEVVVSPVAPGSGERIVEACRGLLARLGEPDPGGPGLPAADPDHVEPPLENRA